MTPQSPMESAQPGPHTKRCQAGKQFNPKECWCHEESPKAASSAGDGHSPMTPEERAKEINKWMISEMGLENLTDSNLQAYLAEQIKLAQKEAVRDAVMNLSNNEGAEIAYAKGFKEGQEDERKRNSRSD